MNLYILIFLTFLITLILLNYIKTSKFFNKFYKRNDEFVLDNENKKNIYTAISSVGIIFFIPFIFSILIITIHYDIEPPNRFFFFLISLLILMILSFYDDYRPIDPGIRLVAQIIFVYVSVSALPLNLVPLPLKVSIFLAVFTWVYLINITNFIDGSDGFCAINVIFFNLGVLILSIDYQLYSFYIAILLLPILFAFLIFNLPNAKFFMGDSGSIFLGFLIGFSFLEIAILINPIYSIILYIYPLVDCSITLFKKVSKGHLPWARLGDYYFLAPKKRINIFKRKKVSLMILRIITIFSVLNLVLFYLGIKLNNNYLYILNFFLVAMAIYIYRNSSYTKKYKV